MVSVGKLLTNEVVTTELALSSGVTVSR